MSKKYLDFYWKRFKISLVIVLLSLSGIFYFFPTFEFLSSKKTEIPLLKIKINAVPRTGKKELELEIDKKSGQTVSSFAIRIFSQKSLLKNEIEKDSLNPISFRKFSELQKDGQFSGTKLGKKIESEKNFLTGRTYKKMLETIKPESEDQTDHYKLPDIIEREQNRKMGRDGEILLLPQINLGELFSKMKNKQGPENIAVENILQCENHLEILDTLWIQSPLTASQIYLNKKIRKKNTMLTLMNSLTTLQKNGLIKSSENSHGEIEYHPAKSIKNLLELINDFIARNSYEKGKVYHRLVTIQSHLILTHPIY
jgi:hypothetical protein